MGLKKDLNSVEAVRYLASFTEEIRDAMADMAVSYNINIIGGSMPLEEDGRIFNVGYLMRRDGSCRLYTSDAADAVLCVVLGVLRSFPYQYNLPLSLLPFLRIC